MLHGLVSSRRCLFAQVLQPLQPLLELEFSSALRAESLRNFLLGHSQTLPGALHERLTRIQSDTNRRHNCPTPSLLQCRNQTLRFGVLLAEDLDGLLQLFDVCLIGCNIVVGGSALPLRAAFGWLRAWTTSLTLPTVPSVDLLAPSWLLRRRLTDWVAVAIALKEDVNLTTFAVTLLSINLRRSDALRGSERDGKRRSQTNSPCVEQQQRS